MRSLVAVPIGVSLVLMSAAACGSTDTRTSSTVEAASQADSRADSPPAAPGSPPPTSTASGSAAPEPVAPPATAGDGSTTTAAAPTTTPDVMGSSTLVRLERPAGTVAVFGDSLFAERAGNASLFDAVSAGILQLGVGADDVRNYAVPGQGVVDGLPIDLPGWHLLPTYLDALGEDPYLADLGLAVIANGRVDVNRLGRDHDIDDAADMVAVGLAGVIDEFATRGTQVVILPAFGANDELFDAMQCAAAGRCDPQRSDAKFAALNRGLVDRGLPVLFDRYTGTDLDDVPGPDRSLFVDFDAGGRFPDDGQHPNAAGERLIAEQLLRHLAAAFGVEAPVP